ncbi:sigma-70 family RNA polymerase sigma factor [Halomonas sp. ANAO-440]|uniref:RNA polymerase sigma factor n=1 Tax=Halomonas sp. ANAO-440 TaxID=2861360 RepID=UPI001CAA8177|nr:sigma-70 family RNA polymerase sigma factor [Halomonas sp. ANAO-440]MBZ0329456.1 sigma-70 family RNA polymerase sigma factor [Halomonas sp. ANAO-440]
MTRTSQLTRRSTAWLAPLRRVEPGDVMTFRDATHRRQWFEQRLEPLMDRLYGTALRLTHNPDDAEDIVAEAVVRAWTRLDKLRDPERFDAWLFHILTNTFISEWRRRQSRPRAAADSDTAAPDDLDADGFTLFQQLHQPFLLWWGSLEDQFFNSLLQEEMQEALDALPDPYRVTIVLVEVQGYTYEEVSGLLGIPLGTVRSRLNRARSLLQKRLWQQAKEVGMAAGHTDKGGQKP